MTFSCCLCARQIGARAGHNLTDRGAVICTRCANDADNHARVAPDCPIAWHDTHDHLRHVAGTRAATREMTR